MSFAQTFIIMSAVYIAPNLSSEARVKWGGACLVAAAILTIMEK